MKIAISNKGLGNGLSRTCAKVAIVQDDVGSGVADV